MVRAEDVISIYQRLSDNGIQVWLTGGWGIDALLGEQTRPHKDLDVIVLLDDVVRMRELLGRDGYGLRELWSENRWVVDARGVETATAFVLQDSEGREFDAHAMCLDDWGNGLPAWEAEGFVFKRQDLAGEGMVSGFAVQCLSPEMQVLCHTGHELPDKQLRDLERLHEKFGVEYPVRLERRMFERFKIDSDAYHRRAQTGPCFICEIVARNPEYPAHVVYEDDLAIAFLDKYPPLYGHTLIAPREHREQVTGDFPLEEYLDLQRRVHRIAEAVRQEVGAERVYLYAFGSNQGNAHVHWHVAPLPPGVPYRQQQLAAIRQDPLRIPEEERASLAARIRRRLDELNGS